MLRKSQLMGRRGLRPESGTHMPKSMLLAERGMPPTLRVGAGALIATVLGATSALAHHPMGGQTPATLTQGLLSGLGHPVIGLDHLAFILGIGLLAAVGGFGPLLPLAFVAAMSGGLALHLAGLDLPGVELAVATSALLIGLAVARPRNVERLLDQTQWSEALVFALAGLFHGYALAESIIGAEATPLAGYVAGLLLCQATLALLAYAAARGLGALATSTPAPGLRLVPVRIAGLAIFAVGALFVVRAAGLTA